MKVSGFTFIRNAIKFDYPVVQSITSVLPVCDEFIVAVGKSEDDTLALIRSIGSPKIKILETVWDESLREGGRVLAVETNKAFDAISHDSTWAFYIQADEVVHEKYHSLLRTEMEKWKDVPEIQGLLFRYLHFYGSYDFVGDSLHWYRKEIRIIRNDMLIRSYKDAQGFRRNGKPLQVKEIEAYIYHYGWVKPPEFIRAKLNFFHSLWHDEQWMEKNASAIGSFDYSGIDSLARFEGEHPRVMQERIAARNWQFSFDPAKKRFSLRTRILNLINKITGWRIGEYRNYTILKY